MEICEENTSDCCPIQEICEVSIESEKSEGKAHLEKEKSRKSVDGSLGNAHVQPNEHILLKMQRKDGGGMAAPASRGVNRRLRNKYCELCDRLFARPSYLQRHMKLHANGKLPSVPQTNMSEIRSSPLSAPTYDLLDLVTAYSHAQPPRMGLLCCHLCSTAFDSANEYNDHMRKHSSDRSHRCAECFRVFALASELKLHELEHRCRQYVCHSCDIFFRGIAYFVRHLHDSHGVVVSLPVDGVDAAPSEAETQTQ